VADRAGHQAAARADADDRPAAGGALALAGVVPLSLWATKDDVLAAAKAHSPALYVVGLAAAALSAAYAGKVLWLVWRDLPADAERGYDTEQPGTRRVHPLQQVPLVVLAAGAAVLGLLVWPPVGEAIRRALGETGVPRPGVVELVISAALAVAVVLAVARWPLPEPRWAAHWLGLGVATQAIVVRPVLRLAEALARFDDRVLDRAATGAAAAGRSLAGGLAGFDDRVLDRVVEATGPGTVRTATVAATIDDSGVDAAVQRVAAETRRIGALARRTQTGLVHQYYIEAAVVLAAALLLLLVAT
jgi:NADH-quinone oxidoreductase subunit L